VPPAERSDEEARLLRDFGYRLHELRGSRGLTQMQLAERAGLHYTYIGQVENGRRNVALVNIYALLRALDADLVDLLPPVQN
jgi:transcriptional regulator with XRE-family HTH domain